MSYVIVFEVGERVRPSVIDAPFMGMYAKEHEFLSQSN